MAPAMVKIHGAKNVSVINCTSNGFDTFVDATNTHDLIVEGSTANNVQEFAILRNVSGVKLSNNQAFAGMPKSLSAALEEDLNKNNKEGFVQKLVKFFRERNILKDANDAVDLWNKLT
jgi:hypothetical protein